jgi:hypothetical protein
MAPVPALPTSSQPGDQLIFAGQLAPKRGSEGEMVERDGKGILGTRTRVAEVLNRRRALSINMIRHLHDKLGISAEVLIRPSRAEAVNRMG